MIREPFSYFVLNEVEGLLALARRHTLMRYALVFYIVVEVSEAAVGLIAASIATIIRVVRWLA